MLALLLGLSTALANGQSSHLWISEHALDHLPDGELKALLTDPAVEDALRTGTMFPDGGYAFSPQEPYGEQAHWEPFQTRYLEWIRGAFADPTGAEAAPHVAFLMGMASHGMADQIYDSLFMERSRVWDAEAGWSTGGSYDEATDVIFIAEVGPRERPGEPWVPDDPLVSLFETHGTPTSAATLAEGQRRLGVAVGFVSLASQNPEAVADYAGDYPWSAEHMHGVDTPGSPACAGAIVARYWQDVYDRLTDGGTTDALVLDTLPRDGSFGHQRDATLVESWVSVVSKRALLQSEVSEDDFAIVDRAGEPHPFEVWLFYRDHSHVVHLMPLEDWAEDEEYTVTVQAGWSAADGSRQAAPWSFSFSTAPPPEAPPREEPAGCGCRSVPMRAGGLLLLAGLALMWRRRSDGRGRSL